VGFQNKLIAAITTLALLCVYQSVQAEIKLAKVEGWSAKRLVGVDRVEIYNDPISSDTYVISSNGVDSLMVSLASGMSKAITIDTSAYILYDYTIGRFGKSEEVEIATLVLYKHSNSPDDWVHGQLEFGVILMTPESVRQDTFLVTVQQSPLIGPSPYPTILRKLDGPLNSDFLLLSIGYQISWNHGDPTYTTKGFTSIWSQFPKEAIYSDTIAYAEFVSIANNVHYSVRYLSAGHFCSSRYCNDYHGTRRETRLWNTLLDSSAIVSPSIAVRCPPPGYFDRRYPIRPPIFGNLDEEFFLNELLVYSSGSRGCIKIVEGEETFELIELLGYDSNFSNVVINNNYATDFSLYDGYILTPVEAEKIIVFGEMRKRVFILDGPTGQIMDSSSSEYLITPIGWYDIYGDGSQYLVAQEDTLLVAYGFDIVTDVVEQDNPALPANWTLSEPHPNPFNPTVSFSLSVPEKSIVTINIYNLLGQKVTTIQNGQLSAGEHNFNWNAKDLPSGLYFIRAQSADGWRETRKAMLLK
jgi:hypothetical protein